MWPLPGRNCVSFYRLGIHRKYLNPAHIVPLSRLALPFGVRRLCTPTMSLSFTLFPFSYLSVLNHLSPLYLSLFLFLCSYLSVHYSLPPFSFFISYSMTSFDLLISDSLSFFLSFCPKPSFSPISISLSVSLLVSLSPLFSSPFQFFYLFLYDIFRPPYLWLSFFFLIFLS